MGPKKAKTNNKKKQVTQPDEHVPNEEKYMRGKTTGYKKITDKKLKAKIQRQEKQYKDAARSAARAELLQQEETGYLEAEDLERTYRFTQSQIRQNVDTNTAKKIFTLDLPDYGPYNLDYTRNGRHLLIGGKKGHMASFDWQTGKLHCELNVNEVVRDVKWLHNETMFAAAQKKYVYIYDNTGLEIHRLQNHTYVDRLDFLPYHFLLASIGSNGYLKYQDTSTGSLVAERRTKFGACNVMTHNPYNAVIHLGHNNGVVSLWSPSMPHPLVKMQCHRGAVRAVAVDRGGHYMATSGSDGKLKVWDIRNYGVLQEYFTPRTAVSLDISDKGLLAVGWNTHAQIWKDCFKTKQSAPYMSHIEHGSAVESLKFVPFEDVLGIGHEKGISSIVVPGAGEANFDSLEANPFQNKKQRQETEVHSLLDKLQPDMIVLDPNTIGKLTRLSKDQIRQKRQDDKDDQEPETPEKERKRMRGRNSALKRHLRKKAKNIVDHKLLDAEEKFQAEKEQAAKAQKASKPFTTLDIFEK